MIGNGRWGFAVINRSRWAHCQSAPGCYRDALALAQHLNAGEECQEARRSATVAAIPQCIEFFAELGGDTPFLGIF